MDLPDDTRAGLLANVAPGDNSPPLSVSELSIALKRTIETAFGHLKTTMKMDVLHCKTVLGVLKELTVFALIYNLVRLVMLQSALQQQIDVERISFLDALRW